MHTPPEILQIIFGHLSKAELKIGRLVCKDWEDAIIPILFEEIFLSTAKADSEVYHSIISQFPKHVKTLTFSSETYSHIYWNELESNFRAERHYLWDLPQPQIDEHLCHSYSNYCTLQQEQMTGFETMQSLCAALRRLPNLRKLVLTDGRPMRDPYSDSVLESEIPSRGLHRRMDEPCSIVGCRLSMAQHLFFESPPRSGFEKALANPLELAMLAMSESSSNITEIVTKPCIQFNDLDTKLFSPKAPLFHDLRNYFKDLNKLRLDLKYEDLDTEFCNGSVAKALTVATQIQSLYLRLIELRDEPLPMTRFSCCLQGCTFSRLQSLFLDGMDSTAEEMEHFVQASPLLKQMTLHRHHLTTSRWEFVVEKVRASCNLKNVEFSPIRGGFSAVQTDAFSWPHFIDHLHSVEAFFLHKGENPFTLDALQEAGLCDNLFSWWQITDQCYKRFF